MRSHPPRRTFAFAADVCRREPFGEFGAIGSTFDSIAALVPADDFEAT